MVKVGFDYGASKRPILILDFYSPEDLDGFLRRFFSPIPCRLLINGAEIVLYQRKVDGLYRVEELDIPSILQLAFPKARDMNDALKALMERITGEAHRMVQAGFKAEPDELALLAMSNVYVDLAVKKVGD
jgi:hypothetical protein